MSTRTYTGRTELALFRHGYRTSTHADPLFTEDLHLGISFCGEVLETATLERLDTLKRDIRVMASKYDGKG